MTAPTAASACVALRATIAARLRGQPADVNSRVGSYPYGWHVCEVEIDAETGVVRIDRYTTIDDVGRAVNPLILHGQTHGGIAQGVGPGADGAMLLRRRDGQLLSGSFMDYAMPRADDFPRFTTALSEVPSTNHPLGFRGGGEGGITPALGVIINAVVDALADSRRHPHRHAGHARAGVAGDPRGVPHSGLRPASFTTLPHLA